MILRLLFLPIDRVCTRIFGVSTGNEWWVRTSVTLYEWFIYWDLAYWKDLGKQSEAYQELFTQQVDINQRILTELDQSMMTIKQLRHIEKCDRELIKDLRAHLSTYEN